MKRDSGEAGARSRLRRGVYGALLFGSSLTLALLGGEAVLAWLGYPTEIPIRAAHPANVIEVREYIEFRYEFATNSAGLRYRETSPERSAHEHRVLVLGDSYTEGLGVDAQERFTERLEREFAGSGREVVFVNGGLSGTSPSRYARLMKYVGLDFDPEGVLICVFANDVANTREDPAANRIDPRRPSRSGIKGLVARVLPRTYTLLATLRARWEYRRRTRTTDFVGDVSARARSQGIDEASIRAWAARLPEDIVEAINENRFGFGVLAYGVLYPDFWVDALDVESPRARQKWLNMAQSLETIVSMARREDVEVAMVFVPVHFQYDPATHQADNIAVATGTRVRSEWLVGPSGVETRLERWAAERRVPFLSLTETFRAAVASGPRLDYALDGHWTPAGHAVAAGELARWLREGSVFSFIPAE